MGLFALPVRMESKVKAVVVEAEEEEEGFLAWEGESLSVLVEGSGIHAEGPSVGRILGRAGCQPRPRTGANIRRVGLTVSTP